MYLPADGEYHLHLLIVPLVCSPHLSSLGAMEQVLRLRSEAATVLCNLWQCRVMSKSTGPSVRINQCARPGLATN